MNQLYADLKEDYWTCVVTPLWINANVVVFSFFGLFDVEMRVAGRHLRFFLVSLRNRRPPRVQVASRRLKLNRLRWQLTGRIVNIRSLSGRSSEGFLKCENHLGNVPFPPSAWLCAAAVLSITNDSAAATAAAWITFLLAC